MQGSALTIFNEKILSKFNYTKWADMKNKLIHIFSKNNSQLKSILNSRKYGGDSDFDEFTIFVTKIMKQIEPTVSEEKIIHYVLSHLPGKQLEFMSSQDPKNLEELNEA